MVDASEQDQLHGFYLVHFDRVDPRGEAFSQGLLRLAKGRPLGMEETLTIHGEWVPNDFLFRDRILGSLGHEIQEIPTRRAAEIIAEWVDIARIEKAPTDD